MQAEAVEPALCKEILDGITVLYDVEASARQEGLDARARLRRRDERSALIVDALFERLCAALDEHVLLRASPFTKAMHFTLQRECELRVFLQDSEVPLDTNHLERETRPVVVE